MHLFDESHFRAISMIQSVDALPFRLDRGPFGNLPPTLEWIGGADGFLRLLDQTRLPHEVCYVDCRDVETVWEAIKMLRVRGAPAIGVAAAYGVCIGTRTAASASVDAFARELRRVAEYLIGARPTAVNLAWAVRRIVGVFDAGKFAAAADAWRALLNESHRMAQEDVDTCRRIGEAGAQLIPDGGAVLTHCNAGALATVAYGTALAAMYVAKQQGKRFQVFADETRPLFQGARLTAYELLAAGMDVTVLCDNAAAMLMRERRVHVVIVGADRIARNGDTANKIGTFPLALAAKHHGVPFYVAAPRSTFDAALANGDSIPIEQRSAEEVLSPGGLRVAATGARAYNPAFDVTPAALIRGIVTENGILEPVTEDVIREFLR